MAVYKANYLYNYKNYNGFSSTMSHLEFMFTFAMCLVKRCTYDVQNQQSTMYELVCSCSVKTFNINGTNRLAVFKTISS